MEKNIFVKQSYKEASDHQKIYNTMNKYNQAQSFFKMMQAAYGFVGREFPKMEKVYMGSRKSENE